jgi:hypothetical protein
MPFASDLRQLARLVGLLQHRPDHLEAGRLLRFDPRERLAVCATTWSGGAETLVGYAAIDIAPGAAPDVLLSDEAAAPGLAGVLCDALAHELAARIRRVA